MKQLVHIINPVRVHEASDLFYAQPITFESMLAARAFCAHRDDVLLCTTQFEEDREMIPEGFRQLSNLTRSVLDVQPALSGRKLPLIQDILEKVEEVPQAEFVVFTNVDIAVMPHFYDYIFSCMEKGHDAIVINRRRLSNRYARLSQLPEMYSDLGRSHPGFDCFVFKRSLLKRLILEDICVGISFLEATLVHNLFSFAEKPLFVPDAHLTFHLGMDVLVPRKKNPYYWHNRKTFFERIYPRLKPHFDLKKFPYAALPLHQRALKWMLNPSLFTRNYLHLEGKNVRQKWKGCLDEIRWRILQR